MKRKAGRPRINHQRQAIGIKIPTELSNKLEIYCQETGASKTWVVWKAIEKYLAPMVSESQK